MAPILITPDELTAAFYEHIGTEEGMVELLEVLRFDNEDDIDWDTVRNNLEVTEVGEATVEEVTVTPHEFSTITFELNGGSFTGAFAMTPPALSLITGRTVGLLPHTPSDANPDGIERDGYRFTGWFEDLTDETMFASWLATSYDYRYTLENFCELTADINGDGEVTPADLTLLARWLVGQNVRDLIAH